MSLSKDSLKYLRHELRTYLNHVIGYSEILQDDLREIDGENFIADIRKVYEEAQNIHKIFNASFYREGKPMDDFDATTFKKNLFGPLYIIIGLAQRLKKQCEDVGADYLLSDVLKVMDSARKVLDLVDQEIKTLEIDNILPHETATFSMGKVANPGYAGEKSSSLGHILVVDDNEMNRDILVRHLERQGHRVESVENGFKTLQILKDQTFDLVLLDIMMPGMNGYQVLEKIKNDQNLRDLPVIMISALDEMDSVVHCISMGAEDYLPKSFDPILLKARISACLSKKHYRDQEQRYIKALLESQKILEAELAEAAAYVRGLLPQPLTGAITSDWLFQPSAKLGGDCFDYHWLDQDNLALYLLDVSGHGIGAALLSVSVMNVLRSQGLPLASFFHPHEVLKSLNHSFQMENQNNMYFTIWYGVYNRQTKEIRYASAGAPPALLITKADGAPVTQELTTTDMIIGVDMDYEYETRSATIPAGALLYLFSDGVYEVKKQTGKMLVFKEFADILALQPAQTGSRVKAIFNQIQGLSGLDHFDDDFSLLELTF